MLALFIWAVRSGQFDDLETPAVRILFDDKQTRSPKGAGARAKESEHTSSPDGDGEDVTDDGERADGPLSSRESRETNHFPGT
jgi:nitrogen fixation-related uncharacterized protein